MCCVKDLSVALELLVRGLPGSREWRGSVGSPAEVLKGVGSEVRQDLLLYLLSWRFFVLFCFS